METTRTILTFASMTVAACILAPKLALLAGALTLLALYVVVPVIAVASVLKAILS